MKVLYLMGCAGVHAHFGHIMRKFGLRTKCIHNRKYDPYGIAEWFGAVMTRTKVTFVLRALWCVLFWKPDIVHCDVHKSWFLWLVKLCREDVKIVLHYHGSDVRHHGYNEREKRERYADKILVATEDLLKYDYLWTPTLLLNPVDSKTFKPVEKERQGLCIMSKWQTYEGTLDKLRGLGHGDINWNIVNVPKISYEKMPAYLGQYEYYADIKKVSKRMWSEAFSMTALQALAVGCKVIKYDGTIHDTVPVENTEAHVERELYKIYKALIHER